MRYKDGAGHQELKVFGVPVLAILKKYRNKKTALPKKAEKSEIRIQEPKEQDKSSSLLRNQKKLCILLRL